MKYNFLYGIPAVLLMTMVFTPAFAGSPSHLTLDSADIFENAIEISAKINVVGNIPALPAGAFGTGVVTTGTLVVTTTHPGVLDSETQANAADPIQHNHYVNLINFGDPQNPVCQAAAATFEVDTISFESPGIAMWPENMYKIWEIPKASPPGEYHDALTGDQLDFVLGNLLGTPFGDNQVVSFQLVPALPDTVCVVVEELLTAEPHPLIKVAGELLQIDTTALMISGISTSAVWLLPVVVSATGIGLVLIRKKF